MTLIVGVLGRSTVLPKQKIWPTYSFLQIHRLLELNGFLSYLTPSLMSYAYTTSLRDHSPQPLPTARVGSPHCQTVE